MSALAILMVGSGPVVACACARAGARAGVRNWSDDDDPGAPGASPGRALHRRHRPAPVRSRAFNAWWPASLARAGVEGDPRRWARVAAGAVLVAMAAAWSRAGAAGAVVAGALVVVGGLGGLRACADVGHRRADVHLSDLLEHTSRNLRAGLDLVTSLEAAAAAIDGLHGPEVTAVVVRARRGASMLDALAPWEAAHARPPVRLVVSALEVASITGGARARALDGVAATLRARQAVAAEARALASQARASAAVLVALPVVVAVLGSAADPRLARTLLGTPIGLGCVAGAAALDGVGAWWMQRVVAEAS